MSLMSLNQFANIPSGMNKISLQNLNQSNLEYDFSYSSLFYPNSNGNKTTFNDIVYNL